MDMKLEYRSIVLIINRITWKNEMKRENSGGKSQYDAQPSKEAAWNLDITSRENPEDGKTVIIRYFNVRRTQERACKIDAL